MVVLKKINKKYIYNEINRTKKLLERAKDDEEKEYLKFLIKELRDFLSTYN